MSLTNENGSGMVMPVGPMYSNGNAFGSGWGGDGFFWLLIIFVIAAIGGNGFGFGGWGGNGGAVNTVNNDLQRGFDQQAVMGGLNGITSGLNGISSQICNGFAQAEIAANSRQMADMNQNFANQQALQAQLYGISNNQMNGSFENRLAVANLGSEIARESCADRQATNDAMMALSNRIDALSNQIITMNYQNQLAQKDDIISQLRSEALYNRGQASQDIQTATIQAGQRALANEIEQYVAPKAIPAYAVPNPNCCPNNRFVA